ncbi:MAG: hypothetical protein JWP45_1122 [Mucilaginibacter sp.]|nr:hypothetical protein [Mucilaginibacter sp.]
MNAISPWAATASFTLADADLPVLYTRQLDGFTFKVHVAADSLLINVQWSGGGNLIFRAAYAPGGNLNVERTKERADGVTFLLISVIGKMKVNVDFIAGEHPILRYKTTLTPNADLLIPFWPRDIVIPAKDGNPQHTEGKIYVQQVGSRSGQLYFGITRPKAGAVLYLQNLTALADYCQQTETSAAEVVGGEWPEIGFALPPTLKGKPLAAAKEVVISDALVTFDMEAPKDEPAIVKQYMDLLAEIYLQLPKPETHYQHWPQILDSGLKDLIDSPGCWSQVAGNHYFNAYVCDYATPPEIMVQLAVLLPLLDYVEWSDTDLEVMKRIKDGLPAFYDEKIGTIMRWHPAAAGKLEGEEEQKKPMVMDSWYLHHPMLNLSRMALKGDKVAEKLFVDSLEFVIKVAHHFNYQWPVFYNIETLEVVKAETQPGKGGEKDVPGLYAHVMLQAWELTGKKKYLKEAEIAAKKLQGLGFELFYQANNTAFSAGAMLRLWKATKNETYKELSYLCLANIFKNVRLWDCNYGYGKNFPSFFALFPLSDAPYTAVYEEQEVFCAFHDYLRHAEGEELLPSARLLVAEYIRYLVERAVYYYPTMLPKEMLSTEVKIGELDPNLWIALEDMHDGWEQCGQVGQEVYGAGNAFGILPRHYMQVPAEDFKVYVDYPTYGFAAKKGKPITFQLAGDGRLSCRMMIVKNGKGKLPAFTVTIKGQKDELKGKQTKDGYMEYCLQGNQTVKIDWERK